MSYILLTSYHSSYGVTLCIVGDVTDVFGMSIHTYIALICMHVASYSIVLTVLLILVHISVKYH